MIARQRPAGSLGRRQSGRACGSEDAAQLKRLIESGEVRTVIDQIFPLDGIVRAHRLAEGGHKRGHAVIRIV